jgi:glycine cleavage system aminomethyltransferase T
VKNVYTNTEEEYRALREGTGLLDYEGVGLYRVSGKDAAAFLGRATSRGVDFLLEGQISTALVLREDGTVVAEALVHCRGQDYLVEVWPEQAEAAGAQFTAVAADGSNDVEVEDVGAQSRVFGVEGPESFKVAQHFLDFPVSSMAYRSFVQADHGGVPLLISRTGVTGEYGFKLHVPADHAEKIRGKLIDLGASEVGLDSVDVCRMEMRFANLERESSGAEITPFDVGLQWMVDLDNDFIGAEAVRAAWDNEPARLPVCWQGDEGATDVPASGTPLGVADNDSVGTVTHAVFSPKRGRVIGTAKVDRAVAASGLEFTIDSAGVRTISAPFLVATSFDVPME